MVRDALVMGFQAALLISVSVPAYSQDRPAQSPSFQHAVDSLATYSVTMGRDFFRQVGEFIFVPEEGVLLVAGHRVILVLDATSGDTLDVIRADEGEQLTFSPDGSHYGIMRFRGDLVDRFVLRTLEGAILWSHDGRGHHHYRIGPGAQTVVGHSAAGHPGKPDNRGSVYLYDHADSELGSYECQAPGAIQFSQDGGALLVPCRSAGIALLDARGDEQLFIDGHHRNAVLAPDGSFIAAVPVSRPSVLLIASSQSSRFLDLPRPISEVGVSPEADLVVAAARDTVVAFEANTGVERWRHAVQGNAPKVVSMSLARQGYVALAVLLDSDRLRDGSGGLYPAAIELLQDSSLLGRLEFEVRDPTAWAPSVFLNAEIGRAILSDQTTFWNLELGVLERR